MDAWTDVRLSEQAITASEWVDRHATGLTHDDPWWENRGGVWDPPLATCDDAWITSWEADIILEIGLLVDAEDDDAFYLAIARSLGWTAAEAASVFWL